MMARNQVHPVIFPCGHVQLVNGVEGSLVEIKEAYRYWNELGDKLRIEFPEFDPRVQSVGDKGFEPSTSAM